MSAESVRAWIEEHAPDLEHITVEASTATVVEAAAALKVEPAQIAKSLAVRAGTHFFLLVASGVARLDNSKARAEFGSRPRMLGPEETQAVTGHPSAASAPSTCPTACPSISTFRWGRSPPCFRPAAR